MFKYTCTVKSNLCFNCMQDLNKQLKDMNREVNQCRDLLGGGVGRLCGGEDRVLMEDTLEGLQERMGLLDTTLEQHCDSMRDKLQEHSTFQVHNTHLTSYNPAL